MHTPSPAADNTPPQRTRLRQRGLPWSRMLDAAPVVVIALYGALWIALHAGDGRGSAHTLWQSLAFAEAVLTLLLRRRKPAGALAGILAVYLLTDLGPLLLPAVLFALLTVAAIRDHRTVALATTAAVTVIAATPYLHGDTVAFPGYGLLRLAAAGAAAGAGLYLRSARRHAQGQAPPTPADHTPASVLPAGQPPSRQRRAPAALSAQTQQVGASGAAKTRCAPASQDAPQLKESGEALERLRAATRAGPAMVRHRDAKFLQGQTSEGTRIDAAFGRGAEALGHPAGGCGRLRAGAGPPWAGGESRDRGLRSFTACSATVDVICDRKGALPWPAL